MGFFKKEKKFLIILGISVAIFLWDLFFLKKTFIIGDYKQQFFPWCMEYARVIKQFTFPFWTQYMGCGFPLVAEGQIGPFYPLNVALFFILPPIAAYSYSIILHFALSGIFMYIFSRKIGLNGISAMIASILFMFSSPYAGCFLNVASLKTLCWFPLVLYIIYLSFEKGKPYIICFSGVVMGMQLLAGSPQMAFYSIIFSALYFLFMLINTEKYRRFFYAVIFLVSGLIALIMASPQLMATNTLVSLSGRGARDLSFSLAMSFMPMGLLSLIFPYTGNAFQGVIYIGVLPLIFAIASLADVKNNRQLFFFLSLFLVSLLCALGRYNPLYVVFLKITKFYLFRVPSKFLFFSAFSLIVMSGFGLNAISDNFKGERQRRVTVISLAVFVLFSISIITANVVMNLWRNEIISFIKMFVTEYFYNPALHKYPLGHYMDVAEGWYRDILSAVSFSNKFVIIQLLVMLASALLAVQYARTVKKAGLYKKLLIFMIFVDLLIFSVVGIGFRGNIGDISSIIKYSGESREFKKDNSLFRIYQFQAYEPQESLQPNMNIYFGIDNVGIYSPLVFKRYMKLGGELGCIDDSTGVSRTSKEILYKNLSLLGLMNVKYISSRTELDNGDLHYIGDVDDGKKIYLNGRFIPRAFVAFKSKKFTNENDLLSYMKSEDFRPANCALVEEEIPCLTSDGTVTNGKFDLTIDSYADEFVSIKVWLDNNGILILTDYFYPGWRCYVDGKRVGIFQVDYIYRGVYLASGSHDIKFVYGNRIYK